MLFVTTGREKQRKGTAVQLDKLGVKHYFVPLQEETWRSWKKLKKLLNFGIRVVFSYHLEIESFNQDHISKYIINLCEELSIQVVIVEYLLNILFFKEFLNLKQKKFILVRTERQKCIWNVCN